MKPNPYNAQAYEADAILIVYRHPDYSNDIAVWVRNNQHIRTHDVDAGASDLGDPETFTEWAEYHRKEAAELRASGWTEAATWLEELVNANNPDEDNQ